MAADENFEQILQDYGTLQSQFEESVGEACGPNTELAVSIVARMRAVLTATIAIDRARAKDPAFDAYAEAWVTRNGGEPLPVADSGRFVN